MSFFEQALSTWSAGGWLLGFLAVNSFLIFAFIFRTAFPLGALIRRAEALGGGLEGCRGEAAALRVFLHSHADGLGTAYAAALNREEDLSPALEEIEAGLLTEQSRDLMLLGALTGAAPLLGLLGTVSGMIATFQATAALAGDTGQQIADGISRALITTQFGLVIALPGVFGHAYLTRRIRELETRLTQCRFLILEALGL